MAPTNECQQNEIHQPSRSVTPRAKNCKGIGQQVFRKGRFSKMLFPSKKIIASGEWMDQGMAEPGATY